MGIWNPLLEDVEFKKQINKKGFFQETKFLDYRKKYSIPKTMERSGGNTAFHLSIDFFSRQSKELREQGYFLLRTGQGNFIIFNEQFFSRSYLNLNLNKFKEITFDVPQDFPHLIEAYKERLTENASLELMHCLGIFKKVITEVTNEKEYLIGPRGNKNSKFDVYFYNQFTKENEKIYSYHGQEELDYSIFTKNSIFVIEGKCLSAGGLDIGWHKISYPLCRFKKFNKNIYPCYFLKQKNVIWFFVFPRYIFHNQGIVLNDKKAFSPQKIFKVSLEGL
jgi:hypothetical protein